MSIPVLVDNASDPNLQKLILETQRRAEDRLNAQMTISLAADARAMTFCGITIAAASLLVGMASESGLTIAMNACGACLYIASALAAYSARPVAWRSPGQKGSDYLSDISENRCFYSVVVEVVGYIDSHIEENNTILRKNANLLRAAKISALLAPIAGAFAEFLSFILEVRPLTPPWEGYI